MDRANRQRSIHLERDVIILGIDVRLGRESAGMGSLDQVQAHAIVEQPAKNEETPEKT
jgi:Na+/alanine symporter